MIINISNHPHSLWSAEQLDAARSQWNDIIDLAFPNVDPTACEEEISKIAESLVSSVLRSHPDAVMCQGEMTLTLALVTLLEHSGIPCYAACSERRSIEDVNPDGETIKHIVFRFVRFRRYFVG